MRSQILLIQQCGRLDARHRMADVVEQESLAVKESQASREAVAALVAPHVTKAAVSLHSALRHPRLYLRHPSEINEQDTPPERL